MSLIAGDGLCGQKVVEMVVKGCPERVRESNVYGADFDRDNTGKYDLAREGGHSESRVLHYKDVTGLEIERTLLDRVHQNPDIEILTHYFAVDLITQQIGRAHVRTPFTNAHLVCRLMLEKKKKKK